MYLFNAVQIRNIITPTEGRTVKNYKKNHKNIYFLQKLMVLQNKEN